jgi:hypothetical protein
MLLHLHSCREQHGRSAIFLQPVNPAAHEEFLDAASSHVIPHADQEAHGSKGEVLLLRRAFQVRQKRTKANGALLRIPSRRRGYDQ